MDKTAAVGFRMIWFLCWLLVVMAAIDGFFTARLKAQIHEPHFAVTAAPQSDQSQPNQSVSPDSLLVDAALNSRYMQWGAVGVMMAMFVWNETKRQPARDRKAAEERKEYTEAFLRTLEKHDSQHLSTLEGIRVSVEHHVQRFIESKDKHTEALHELASEIRSKS
jgi:hypothetical protein